MDQDGHSNFTGFEAGKKKWPKRRRVFSEGFPGRWEMNVMDFIYIYIYIIYMNGISNILTGIGFCSSTVARQVRGGDDDCDAFAKLLRQNLHESLGNNALKIKKGIDKGAFDSTVANQQMYLVGVIVSPFWSRYF